MTDMHYDGLGVGLANPAPHSPLAVTSSQICSASELADSSAGTPKNARIMIIDDEPINIKVVRKYLQMAGYENFITTTDSTSAIEIIAKENPDIILLDIMMPTVDGLEILEKVRSNEQLIHVPIVILTASNDQPTKQKALEIGATDFLAKPVDPSDLVPRVRNALLVKSHYDRTEAYAETLEHEVRKRTAALARSRLDVVHCLGRAADYRDNETGQHVVRVGLYVGVIARGLGLDAGMVELLEHASPLHDVGKIGIPDAILLKPGKLTAEEFEAMQKHSQLGKKVFHKLSESEELEYLTHAELGLEIMGVAGSPLLNMAARIALCHHEKWDGSGYPLALAGEDIPLEGRITAVADVFDALSSKRPYKPAFPRKKCFAIMEDERGKHFDPRVLDVFFSRADEITKIQIARADMD
ncbi:MAG: response regulator [Planctomycetes bacterium]|nr:response regulator [Planctomycetota bacterium]